MSGFVVHTYLAIDNERRVLSDIRFLARGVPVKEPAFVQQLDLTSVLFAEGARQLIAEPLRQGYLLLLLIPSVWIAYGEKAQSVQVYMDLLPFFLIPLL